MLRSLADLYRAQQRRTIATMRAARRLWLAMPDDLDAGWATTGPRLTALVTAAQLGAATDGALSVHAALAEQAVAVAPLAVMAPEVLAGVASDGRRLDSLLYSTVTHARSVPADSLAERLRVAQPTLDRIVHTQVADAARVAQSVAIATRPGVGYVRVVNPPCCSRCAVLAGRWFRWNTGFPRHPHCDCIHAPCKADSIPAGYADAVPLDKITDLTSAERKALEDIAADRGDDFAEQALPAVVNARRGASGMTTTEGMSRRGMARFVMGGEAGDGRRRLTPEGIYAIASDRDEALHLLERHGYLVGSVRGKAYEGWGQMGRGGTRVGVRQAIERARATGVRDPHSLATMTAAERRTYDAALRG